MNIQVSSSDFQVHDPHAADRYAGNQVRQLRKLRKFSQTALAEKLGVSFQQIQKYESARNRISLSMASKIAAILEVPPSTFFADKGENDSDMPSLDCHSAHLVSLFQNIKDNGTRMHLLGLIEGFVRLSNSQNGQPPAH